MIPVADQQRENEIGLRKEELDTPALLLDLAAFEKNTSRIAETCQRAGIHWRPHTKALKTPALAQRLVQAGAIGITCAKLGEAEVMAAAGIREILVANQVVGRSKAIRLARLQSRANVMVALDSEWNAREISEAAEAAQVRIPVVIEVNTGQDRAGLEPGSATLAFARQIAGERGLKLRGLMTWEAHAAKLSDPDEKARAVKDALRALVETAALCRQAGFEIEVVSCGGTATYWLSAACPGVTEIQAGGGVFGDVHYRTHYGVPHDYALTLLATVTSRPNPARVICDAGKKAMSGDTALPLPLGLPDVKSVRLNAEHTIIETACPHDRPRVGERLEFVVGYSDTTVHLHDQIYGIRNGSVETVWNIEARGKLR